MTAYDVIVIGAGGVGSATVYELARRGVRVLGLEQFPLRHARGASHGETRIIRQAYFEHPDYVPLLQRAYALWRQLEATSGCRLMHQTGLIEVGPPNGVVIPGVLQSAAAYGVAVETVQPGDLPQFEVPPGNVALLEPDAGYLLVEACVSAYLEQARDLGAELRDQTRVISWEVHNKNVHVQTADEQFVARKIVVAAGAWSSQVLREMNIPLTVRRKHQHWLAAPPQFSASAGCPAFFYERPDGYFYGLPQITASGLKLAEHSGGEAVADPTNVDRSIDPDDLSRVTRFASECLAIATPTPMHHSVCMYTCTADEHFVVDLHPEHPQVALVAGLSGHGFKFVGVLAEAVADLTLTGKTDLPTDFLRLDRFE